MKFASDLADGFSDLAGSDPGWRITAEPFDPPPHLEQAIQNGNLDKSLESLAPGDSEYRALRQALADYRKIESQGGWPSLPPDGKLKPGQSSPLARDVARRLGVSGEMKLAVRDRGQVPLRMRVVVGNETLPAVMKDSGFPDRTTWKWSTALARRSIRRHST